ncbi:hypothetical protein ZWY2020_014003 [Hordeum vulgare]|nr:hypothetical protein ZWY2020_014003 [Hordeum vulgare]
MEVENRYVAVQSTTWRGPRRWTTSRVKAEAVRWTPEVSEVLRICVVRSRRGGGVGVRGGTRKATWSPACSPGRSTACSGQRPASSCPRSTPPQASLCPTKWGTRDERHDGVRRVLRCNTSRSPARRCFVSAASGSVGSLVSQFAKLAGCHVVGCARNPSQGGAAQGQAGVRRRPSTTRTSRT